MKSEKDRIRSIVRHVVNERLGEPDRGRVEDDPTYRGRELITEQDVMEAHRAGRRLVIRDDTLLTPLAWDAIGRYRISIENASEKPTGVPARDRGAHVDAPGTVVIGSDHGGFAMKQMLVEFLTREARLQVHDVGTDSKESCDYPDYAAKVADRVAAGRGVRGIIIDGAGIGSAMVANKTRGVRAAPCSNIAEARNARAHNDANVLCLGAGLLDDRMARAIAVLFLTTDFEGGRHQRRVDKIMRREA